jgi:multidrug resistance efflux pump
MTAPCRLTLSALVLAAAPGLLRGDEPKSLQIVGTVGLGRVVVVAGPTGGVVTEVLVREGQVVKAGEVLARLDDREARVGLARAKAAMMAADARLREAMAGATPEQAAAARLAVERADRELEIPRRQLERMRKLLERNAVGPDEVAEAESKLRLAELNRKQAELAAEHVLRGLSAAQIDMVKAEMELARADVHLAELRLDQATVRAPWNGTVLSCQAVAGGPASAVCILGDLDSAQVEVNVPEASLGRVALDQACVVRFAARPGEQFSGRVLSLGLIADPARRTVPVVVRLGPAQGGRIIPGLSAEVTFATPGP